MRIRGLVLSLVPALLACSSDAERTLGDSTGAAGTPGGTVVITVGAIPKSIFPPLVSSIGENQIADIIYDRLAEPAGSLNTVGMDGFEPELAAGWEWGPDSLSIVFRIDPRARWHDGVAVTARDVKFTYELYVDSATNSADAPLLANIDSVSVRDSLTAVFWYKRRYPEQFFDAAYQMRIMPQHALASVRRSALDTSSATRRPIGSGRFRFANWSPGSLELVADTANFLGRPKLDRLVWVLSPDYDASLVKLIADDADFLEFIRPDKLSQLARNPQLRVLTYPSLNLGFIQFNLHDGATQRDHPILGNVAMRRALSMAIDRARIVRTVFDTLGRVAIGPTVRALGSADSTIALPPFDPGAARRILDSLGWTDPDGDTLRTRGGKPLRFTLIVPSSSGVRKTAAEAAQQMLKDVGVDMRIEMLEINAWLARSQGRTFDATFNSTILDPSPSSIRQAWGSESGLMAGGRNHSGYQSRAFDAYVDSAIASMDAAKGKAYYRRAYETIVADAPAIWLYELVNVAGVDKALRTTGLRADAWWARIADWSWEEAAAERTNQNGGTPRTASR